MNWVRVYDMPFHVCLFILSSPFLLVFGNDRVTCYTGPNNITGDGVDPYSRSGA